ncbi:MAG TPA: 16S rRNA (cytosine(1402)-N(4))-methyltransferase RsmH [Thermoanaerobaculia bacterium]|nr:16S rRNA (cytosine(1402)-N(4))-methyltransferase RsmH [Thermoanaerobaculia bacterium]
MRETRHEPVLFSEVVEWLRPARADGLIVDATVGLGGHAEGLLRAWPEAELLAIDRDPLAIEKARSRLRRFDGRVRFVTGRYEELIDILEREGIEAVDAVLADLGVSSMQIDEPGRGFSFRAEGPLDMRMSSEGVTAADLVNRLDEDEIARILREYGEEPMARRIARAIVGARSEEPITTTTRLAEIVRGARGHGSRGAREKIDPATLTFQALRIATNEELTGLERFIDDAVGRLVAGGRLAIISFHSLEDRIVKRAFRRLAGECTCPPRLPVCGCGAKEVVRRSKLIGAGEDEVERNPRARSAKLRIAEKKGNSESA